MRIKSARITIIICAFTFIVKAQIIIPNKDLEGNACGQYGEGTIDTIDTISYCALPYFALCERFVGVYPNGSFNQDIYPKDPFQGNTFVSIGYWPNVWWGSISTKLDCAIHSGRKYIMTLWAAKSISTPIGISPIQEQTLVVWGNSDSCSRVEKLWESENIDTGWHQYTAVLTPKQQNYEYIHFRVGFSDTYSRFIALDALSDIYPFNANDVTATIKDTTFTKPNTTCIELNATANITTYDTVYWQDAAGNKIADGFNGGTVCPDTSTYYIIAMRDSVPDCAGIWWSYDTVRVTVNMGTAVAPLSTGEGLGVRLFPNPATNTITIQTAAHPMQQISIYDISGKMLFTQQTNQTTQTQIALEGIIQTSGVYIAEITLTNGVKHRAKFLKQ